MTLVRVRRVLEIRLARGLDIVEAADRRRVRCFLEAHTVIPRFVGDGDHRVNKVIERLFTLGLGRLDEQALGSNKPVVILSNRPTG